tara:strand:+ start:133 stop:375 length:243 start_codon:yes stop_codon:yes gene_type:complete
VLSEVEKIWILYDLDGDGHLAYEEVATYLRDRAYPYITLSDDEVSTVFNSIDHDESGTIDREEMNIFVEKLIELHDRMKL